MYSLHTQFALCSSVYHRQVFNNQTRDWCTVSYWRLCIPGTGMASQLRNSRIPHFTDEYSRAGVLNRGEISPMGEILGIQGGNESVWKLLSFQNWWHKMVPLVYFWRINFSHSNTMPFNSRLAVIEINRCQWCHHIAILRYVGLGKGGNNKFGSGQSGKIGVKG